MADPASLAPKPQDGAAMGELMMRGNIMMKGYLKDPAATDAAFAGGWFHTGDLGVWHADGYAEIRDRAKDIIISGGENISTIEVESVLYRHPAVLEAAVVARPDEKWGETPCAFVTLKAGCRRRCEASIIAFCREHIAHYKAPRTVSIRYAAQDLDREDAEICAARDRARALPPERIRERCPCVTSNGWTFPAVVLREGQSRRTTMLKTRLLPALALSTGLLGACTMQGGARWPRPRR